MQTNNGTETTVRQTSKPHYPSRRDKSARAVQQIIGDIVGVLQAKIQEEAKTFVVSSK